MPALQRLRPQRISEKRRGILGADQMAIGHSSPQPGKLTLSRIRHHAGTTFAFTADNTGGQTMKSFCLHCSAALIAGVALVAHGVTDETPDPFGDAVGLPDVSEAVVEVPAPQSDVEGLRAKYLEAARQRAEMMDEDALREAVETEEKSVTELRARQALRKVEQELERIGDEYSDTIAGRNAVVIFNELQKLNRNGRVRLRDTFLEDHFENDRAFDDPDGLEPRKDNAFGDLPETDATPVRNRDRPFRPSKHPR